MRRSVQAVLVVVVVLLAVPVAAVAADTARYILPPGNFGGLPTTANSLDQLPLYDALTPLRDNITDGGASTASTCPRTSLRSARPTWRTPAGPASSWSTTRYGIPHVYGKTRADMAFGAGWTTARDRGLLIQLGRGPARVAVADVPGINAFGLVTSGQNFVPSPAAEALVTAQKDLLVKTYGDKGRQILRDAQAYADGVNAYLKSIGSTQPTATVNDVIAVTAFIGSIFGAGGGGEATQLRAARQARAGPRAGARLPRLGRRDAGRRPRGADHDQAPLPLPGVHRRAR